MFECVSLGWMRCLCPDYDSGRQRGGNSVIFIAQISQGCGQEHAPFNRCHCSGAVSSTVPLAGHLPYLVSKLLIRRWNFFRNFR